MGLVAESSVLSDAGGWRVEADWTWEGPTFGCILYPTSGQLDSDLREDFGSRRADKLLVDLFLALFCGLQRISRKLRSKV